MKVQGKLLINKISEYDWPKSTILKSKSILGLYLYVGNNARVGIKKRLNYLIK